VKTYIVLAYRWGSTNDHWYWLYAGPDLVKASALAESERDGRGRKYGCAVYETNDTGDEWTLAEYHGSGDEKEPAHNWRLDYFERLGHVLDDYVRGQMHVPSEREDEQLKVRTLQIVAVEPDPMLVKEAERHRHNFDVMRDAQAKQMEEMRERREKIACMFCDAWPVYEVDYHLDVLQVPRDEYSGSLIVEDLHGTYCRRCEQLWQRPDQIHYNQMRMHIARQNRSAA